MSTIGIFFRGKNKTELPRHPRPAPGRGLPICEKSLREIFSGCADFTLRPVWPGMARQDSVSVCWLDGLVSGESVSRDVLRPLTDERRVSSRGDPRRWMEQLLRGAVWSYAAVRCADTDELVARLLAGNCAVVFDALGEAVCFEVRGSAARAVGPPTVEKTVKGGKEAFVETLRVNTALVRRRLCTPALKLSQTTVGRKSGTAVAVLYLEGVAAPETAEEVRRRLDAIDIDGLTAAGHLEQYLVDRPYSPFPQLLHTERPDAFAAELLAGRVGILADGLPLGFLLPATLPRFLKTADDRAQHFVAASLLTALRWFSMALSALFPALLTAVGMYHQEMLPTRLLRSMIAAKQEVPFSVAVEVLAMLLAFELLMEAGIRLPDPVGDTVSIIGALIVGQSAVDARIVSPVAVIVVAASAICGFTMPSRDLCAALRLARFGLVFLATFFGLFGIAAGCALLLWYLCTIESFGVPYTAPLSEGGLRENRNALFRPPLRAEKRREAALHTPDRRNQA